MTERESATVDTDAATEQPTPQMNHVMVNILRLYLEGEAVATYVDLFGARCELEILEGRLPSKHHIPRIAVLQHEINILHAEWQARCDERDVVCAMGGLSLTT